MKYTVEWSETVQGDDETTPQQAADLAAAHLARRPETFVTVRDEEGNEFDALVDNESAAPDGGTPDEILARIIDEVAQLEDAVVTAGGEDDNDALIAAWKALPQLKSALSLVTTVIENALKAGIEANGGSIRQDDLLFQVHPVKTWGEIDHTKVLERIVGAAAVDENGEVRPGFEAAEAAATLTWQAYCSESTRPKTGVLGSLQLDMKEVARRKLSGRGWEITTDGRKRKAAEDDE